MTQSLKGRVAVVTGASRGIGRAIALAMADAGAQVAFCHKEDGARATETLELLKNKSDAFVMDVDVSNEQNVTVFFEQVIEMFGRIDIVVSNAGIIHEAPLVETQVDDFDKVINVNLRGCFLVNREAARHMKGQGDGGNIINIASDLGYLGRENMVSYCASKGGVISLTRSLARELAPDIRVNAIAPGPIDTDMTSVEFMSKEALAKDLNTPLGRYGKPDDIAAMAVFLASPQASFTTGQCYGVNGGSVMQ
ncbi:MAG: 3-oxoacyl-ACP reductase FabG [Thiovulaceae bacterium]|nr:3-oxoacyl-ACP reductase FabG [Sulfurimonadaceae bacterium]